MIAATQDILVDVGNSRMKWARVAKNEIADIAVLPLEDDDLPQKWQTQADLWTKLASSRWTLAGSNPRMMEHLRSWLDQVGQKTKIIDQQTKLPIEIAVDAPEQVGRDRLLSALATTHRPAIIISAGSAVTVDVVAEKGQFLGGSIFPGMRMMAAALHDYTAKLPKVEVAFPTPRSPGKNTVDAIQSGIVHAVVGGITACCSSLQKVVEKTAAIYITGGDGSALRPCLPFDTIDAPLLTLQGILIASKALWP